MSEAYSMYGGLRKQAQKHSLPLLVAPSGENYSNESQSELMKWNFRESWGNATTNSDWRELVINILFQSEFKLPYEEISGKTDYALNLKKALFRSAV